MLSCMILKDGFTKMERGQKSKLGHKGRITSRFFMPDLCHIEVKLTKNIHKQKKPNKNWKSMESKGLQSNLLSFKRL
jgi:hypothetical protein